MDLEMVAEMGQRRIDQTWQKEKIGEKPVNRHDTTVSEPIQSSSFTQTS